jgi:hypothetical protein
MLVRPPPHRPQFSPCPAASKAERRGTAAMVKAARLRAAAVLRILPMDGFKLGIVSLLVIPSFSSFSHLALAEPEYIDRSP